MILVSYYSYWIFFFFFKYTVEDWMKSQEEPSDAYPTFSSSGEYLDVNLNYWNPPAIFFSYSALLGGIIIQKSAVNFILLRNIYPGCNAECTLWMQDWLSVWFCIHDSSCTPETTAAENLSCGAIDHKMLPSQSVFSSSFSLNICFQSNLFLPGW